MAQPKQSEGIPLEDLSRLPEGEAPWVPGGPLWPRNVLVLGSWWILREIEVSNSRLRDLHVDTRGGPGAKAATWYLAASKNDTGATG
eukprot:1116498-Heterocapsa_arctica.AAC.1